MSAPPTSRGWRFELDGFTHVVEVEERRVLGRSRVFLDDRLVAQLPRVMWSIVGAPFRIGAHQAILDCGVRMSASGESSTVVYGLRVDGAALGPPHVIEGRPDRPAVARARPASPQRRVLVESVTSAAFGLGAGFILPAGLSTGSTRAPGLELIVWLVGLASVVGIPVAGLLYVRTRRWGWAQEAFLGAAAPFLAAFAVGWGIGTSVTVDAAEIVAGIIIVPAFVLLGLLGLSYTFSVVRGALRRDDAETQPGQPSKLFAIGVAMLSLGIMGIGLGGLAAMLGLAGATLHDAGSTVGSILLGSVALMVVSAVPILLGKPKRAEPGSDMG